jgi:hypothetical protein
VEILYHRAHLLNLVGEHFKLNQLALNFIEPFSPLFRRLGDFD